jgi:hypothetical protein
MTSAHYSVNPGAGCDRFDGGRAVWLYLLGMVVCFALTGVTQAEPKSDLRETEASQDVAAETASEVDSKAVAVAEAVEVEEAVEATDAASSSEDPTERAEAAPAADETVAAKVGEPTIRRIGPVTTVTEVSSGVPFPARVDTGATTCSIHYEAIEIEDPAASPEENIGKRVRILIVNPDGEREWIDSKIVDHVTVRTTTDDDERYKVQLKLRWQDVEKKVLVTLRDREKMKYPLLIGRNFLRGDFLVDVGMDAEK